MKARIEDNMLDDILSRVDIVELISAYLPLKRAGRNFRACCPFHNEKTPSFMVSPEKQIYHCFGCGESGNAFKFLMQHERMEFIEAVECLAKRCGIVLPERSRDEKARGGMNEQIFNVNELAASFFESQLHSACGLSAREYLSARGLNLDAVKRLRLGFASDNWDALINFMRKKQISIPLLETAGLVSPRQGGGFYDRFRNRIIFPISDLRSRVVGFGARVYGSNDNPGAKYINSPETAVYVKGKNLYGLNLSKDAIRQNDCAIVVEGYLDFLIPYQEGINNIVASQGTALTQEQIRLLKRFTENVVIVFDGDQAGESAALRALELLVEDGINVKVSVLPQGDDPDTFVRREGAQAFYAKVRQASDIFDYKLNILKSRHNPASISGKDTIVREMLLTIRKFSSAVVRSEYLRVLSGQINISEEALLEEFGKLKEVKQASEDAPCAKPEAVQLAMNPAEKLLIQLMLQEHELISRIRDSVSPVDFQSSAASDIVQTIFELADRGMEIGNNTLLNHFSEHGISGLLCESAFLPEVSAEEKEKMAQDCVKRIKMQTINSRRRLLHEQIKDAQVSGDRERLDNLLREFNTLIQLCKG